MRHEYKLTQATHTFGLPPTSVVSPGAAKKQIKIRKERRQSKHFTRENQLLDSDTCLVLFPGHVGMQSQNETK